MAPNFLGLFALAAFCCTLTEALIPSYMKVCGRRNPKLDQCVTESVYQLVPKLKTGIPELEAPSLEPLYIDTVTLADLNDFSAVAKNLTLSGVSGFVIKRLKVDLDNHKIELELVFPTVLMKSDYDVKAKILVPISERGPIDLKTENAEAKIVLKFKHLDRRGRTFVYFPTMTCKLTIKDYTAIYKPSANDSPITQAINEILVTNRKEILESMVPNLEKAVSQKVLEVANRICKHFTFDELLPDRL